MSKNNKVLDFVGKREENIEVKRRNFERVLFQNMLGAYSVIESNNVVYPIDLLDISHDGCQFQVPKEGAKDTFELGKEISLRMYFTHKSYVPVVVNIKHVKSATDSEGQEVVHIGGEFDKSTHSFEVMKNFIKFVYSFAENSVIDSGEVRTFFY